MLKPKSNQSSGCTRIHQTNRKSLNKFCLPARKLMATVFWDRKGVLQVKFIQQGTTIVSQLYCETLKKLHKAFQNERRGMLITDIVLLHDNARPHTSTAARTRVLLEHFNWELFVNLPYSFDLAPSDYHPFTYLKNWLGSQRFNSNELMEGVKT
jgi:hypothetical protein